MTGCRGTAAVLAASMVVLGLSAPRLEAEDWPQWRGVGRDAVWRDAGLVERFADGGLIEKWRAPVGGGFAGPAVAGGRVFVLDYEETPGSRTMDGHERLAAFDEETGERLWAQTWPATYRNIHFKFATGPRATPTVDGDRVYVLGAAGMLSCFDTATGDLVWRIDAPAEYGVTVPVYGVSQSPLVEGDLLIVVLGGEPDAKIAAFDKATGHEVWRALENTSETGYSSPIVIDAGGARQLVVVARGRDHVARSDDRRRLLGAAFRHRRRAVDHDAGAQRALPRGQPVLQRRDDAGSEPGPPGRAGAVAGAQPRRAAGSDRHPARDHLDPDSRRRHPLRRRELRRAAGHRRRQRQTALAERPHERPGPWATAYFVRNRDRWFVTNDSGDLIIARFSPEGYEEIDRTQLLAPTTRTRGGATGRWGDRAVLWAHPAFANRHVVARNDAEVVRLSLAAADYE